MGELKEEMEIKYIEYGLTDEVLELSQRLDPYIVEEQRELLSKWKS